MTSPRPIDQPTPPDLTGLHDLLWHLRWEGPLVACMHDDPVGVCAEFGVPREVAGHLTPPDVSALLALGTNPYLLFFAMLELGMPRADYYAQLTGDAANG